LAVKHIMRTLPSQGVDSFQKWGKAEHDLNESLQKCSANVHKALCDNIDTRTVLETMRDLVSYGNSYIMEKSQSSQPCNRAMLKNIASYITKIFDILGLISKPEEIGFATSENASVNVEELVMPHLTALADFRDKVRKEAINIKATNILTECDNLRNNVLPELGVRLEDKENEATVIKLVDKNELLREREEKKLLEEKKNAEKEQKKAEAAAKQAELDAKRKMPPSEIFKGQNYSKFDDKGIPTHNIEGEELPKSQIKKLQKIYAAQEKKYNEYLKSSSQIEQ
jgi:cysteinyl-tRNA synthetase